MAGLRRKRNYVQEALTALNAGDVATPIQIRGSVAEKRLLRQLEKLRSSVLEREFTEARIVEQNKLAIASVAHDIKTPLALISGYAECLQDGMDDKDYLSLISEKTEQLNGLVLKLVETSQHEISEIPKLRDLVDTKMFFGSLLEKFEPVAKQKNIKFKVRKIPSAHIYVDKQEMERVVQNLISNAVKYTDEGGSIEVFCKREGESFVLNVQDTGRGIDRKSIPFVFDKFYMEESSRTDSKSSGLGLYVTKYIVEKHGGTIKVKSKKGKGSRFIVSLPEVADTQTPTQRFERMPKFAKLLLFAFFGWIMPGVLRVMRYFESKRLSTFVIGILALPMFMFIFPVDFISEIFYNRMVFAMD